MKKVLFTFAAWLFACSNLWAAQAFVGSSTANGTGSSLSGCSRTGTTTGNGLVYFVVMNLNQTIATFTMSGETVVPKPVAVGEDGDTRIYSGVIQALAGGGTKTLAASFSGAANWACSIFEVSGQNTTAFVDATGQGTGVGNSPTLSANVTPLVTTVVNAGVIVVGAGGGSNPVHVTSGYTDFAINTGISGAAPGGMYNMDVGAAGMQTVQMSLIGSSAHWTLAAIATRSVDAVPDVVNPTPPTGMTATVVSSNQIDLLWVKGTDETQFVNTRVERCGGVGCTGFVEISANAGTTFSDTGLVGGTIYRYRFKSYDGTNFSSYTAITQTTTFANIQRTITWADLINTDHTGYVIERKTLSTGTYADLTSVGPGIRQYIDTASPLPEACFMLHPMRSTEEGPDSTEVCSSATSTPMAPSGFKAANP